jgi:hypothetical protein
MKAKMINSGVVEMTISVNNRCNEMKSPIDVNDAVLCEVSFTEADELSSLP